MVHFAGHVLDELIAPGASAFTKAAIPDMSEFHKESKHWVATFFLNSLVRSKFAPPHNAYLYNYFRRAEAAFREHDLARAATLNVIASGSQSPSRYATAIFHWEIFLGQAWHAFKLLEKAFGFILYAPGSSSVEERLNHLYNQMKHVESRIAAGQMPPGATVPVWLTNEGLVSIDAQLNWEETAEVLREVAKWADVFVDPMTAPDKFRSMLPTSDQ